MTTLRNVIGGMALEETLTSRDEINAQLRGVLDEATGKWGIRVNRVELKAIDPPPSIKDSMEKQMRADRDKRAAILAAEGVQAVADPDRARARSRARSSRAEGQRAGARSSQAEGQAKAIDTVFRAIHEGDAGPEAARLPVPAGAAADRAGRGRTRSGSSRARSRGRSDS